ncbi:hypothetical protein [Amycolatopsis vastitatis]|uniref:SpoVT-AbrB domain-containing protein n=1 Tax=Amycolatopsis vastitatis TaxID=1905142 RepID=A0A229SQS4_9PSEU|nr:hypothetical protein [Amycolatopsis vastitatis]OXM61021.1 hypothetical protein CF165_40285 [Amycolatopsis vastitatis]
MSTQPRRARPDRLSFALSPTVVLEQLVDGVRTTTLPRRGIEPKIGDPAQVPTVQPPQNLPVAALIDRAPRTATFYAVTTIDTRGRLADRSPLRVLGWPPLSRISIGTINGELIIVRRCDGPDTITGQGHVRLPARIRHLCRLEPGGRLLVAAFAPHGLLAVYTNSALDAMLRAYHQALRAESRIPR